MADIFTRQAFLQEKINGKVRCNTCQRRCTLKPDALGWCRTRTNRDGVLYTQIYGAMSSLSANPIEKKPFYHFHPGTYALTAGSWSCNFGCPWCQNWRISKSTSGSSQYISPKKFVQKTIDAYCQGTSISFNEPTLSLEWSLEVFRFARQRGLYNTYVTNGYMTPEALLLLIDAGLDAMNVDLKGDAVAVRKFCKGIHVDRVWETCRLARGEGIHLEITTLVIPTVNDSEGTLRGIANRIASELGVEVPWHISAYHSAYKFNAPPTPLSTLEHAWRIGQEARLEYVYIANLPGHPYDNTYCPRCGQLLIQRYGFDVLTNELQDGDCKNCGAQIAGVWG